MLDLRHQVPINADPRVVFEAIATSKGNRGWWTADSRVDEKAGGKAEFGFDKRSMVFRMSVDRLVPEKEVVMTCHGDHPEWDSTKLTWLVTPEATVRLFSSYIVAGGQQQTSVPRAIPCGAI